jgi:arabinofuranan 3-O-arabinosyltransferase
MSPHAMSATFVRNTGVMGPPPSRVAVETEAGSVVQPVRAGSSPQALRVPPGRTRWLRIRILGLAWRVPAPGLPRAGISELTVDGLHVGRHYQLPAVPRDSGPASFVMTRGPGAAPECMKGPDRWVCSPALRRGDEENGGFDRVFPAPAPAAGALSGLATLTDTALLQRFTGLGSSLRVTASSSRSADPAVLPRSAFDDDPATAWIPGENDIAPTLTLTWGHRTRRIDRLTVERPPGARGALRVRVRGRGGDTREGLVNSGGRLSFAPLNTDRLSLTFLASGLQTVQVTEVAIAGVRPFPRVAAFPIRLACGLGPGLEVNGVTVPTRVSGAMGDLLEGRPLRFQGCRDAEVAAGRNGLRPSPFGAYRIESAVIDTGRAPGRPHPGSVEIRRWSAGTRLLEVETGHRSFLVVDENFNRGWQATIGRDVLSPVRLDGWKQGWVLPAGAKGMVRLTYLPDRIHRVAVPAGLGVLALLSLLAFAGYRPGGPRPAPPPARPRLRTARWAVPLSAAGLGFWLAGPAGLVVICGAALIFAWSVARRQAGPVTRRSRLAGALASSWVIGGLMVAGTVSWALGAWLRAAGNPAAPTDLPGDVIPQLLGLVILGRLVTGLWHADRGDGPARRRDHLWRRPGERPDRARWPASRWTGRSRR